MSISISCVCVCECHGHTLRSVLIPTVSRKLTGLRSRTMALGSEGSGSAFISMMAMSFCSALSGSPSWTGGDTTPQRESNMRQHFVHQPVSVRIEGVHRPWKSEHLYKMTVVLGACQDFKQAQQVLSKLEKVSQSNSSPHLLRSSWQPSWLSWHFSPHAASFWPLVSSLLTGSW